MALAPLFLLGMMLVELVAFFLIAQVIGAGWAVLLVLVASVVGLVLLRREGMRAWRRFREAVRTGSPPGPHVTDGLVGLGGALLLTTPGLLSGVVGALLLLPPVRGLARGRMQARAERLMSAAEAGQAFGPRRVRVQTAPPGAATPDGTPVEGDVLEGEIIDPR